MAPVAEFHVEAVHSLRLNQESEDDKKLKLLKGGGQNCFVVLSLVLSVCLLICSVSIFGATINADVYELKTSSVCATDSSRCSCDSQIAWPVATRAFYDNAPYTQSAADWYASTMGWVFDPIRGICPLGAVQVWVTLSDKLQWQGTLEQYQNEYSSGDVNVSQRRLSGEVNSEGNAADLKLFQANEAHDFLKANTEALSALASDVSEMAHNVLMSLGLASEKAPLVLNVGDPAPKGFHRQLASSSSSSSKPKPKTHYNYRFCLRKEYKDQITEVWKTADDANAASGIATNGKSFVKAYSDFTLGQTLITVNVVFATVFFFPFIFLYFYALKYEYTGFGGPKYMGKGLFPFTAAMAICVILVILASKTSSAIDKNDFLSMPVAGWEPFLPGCAVSVVTSTASTYAQVCLGLGITILCIMIIVAGQYVYFRMQPKSAEDMHEESLMSVDAKIPYMMDSVKPREAE